MSRITAPISIATTLLCLALFAPSASAASPTISKTTLSHVKTTSAILEADINPQGKATLYRFEYGPADCASNPCTSVPLPEGQIAKGESPVRVKAPIEGLTPHTTYHFRALAKNSEGEAEGPDRAFTTHLEPPPFDPCPNDPFRSNQPSEALPDCRAYEQASPVEKNGLDALGSVPTVKAAANGEGIGFAAANGLPGGKGAQETPLYFALREGLQWSTQGMLPPESTGQEAYVLGWTPNFSQTFSQAKLLSTSAMTFLSISSADGSLAHVAPHTKGAEYFYVDSSADDSEVFFEAIGPTALLPAAAPGKANLYVWDRANDELKLAGVMNDGKAPASGSFAGPYDWIQGESKAALEGGGAKREYYVQDDHAVSSDGDRVYFTAGGSGTLFVRENPSAEQSPLDKGKCTDLALACTIEVSASQKDNGKGLNGTDAAGKRPAAFQAASTDGSSVLLTSSEKLTKDANTGTEPEPPAIARANVDGTGANLAFLPTSASGIDTDASHLYWADPTAGTIGRADLDGKNPDPDFIPNAGSPEDVAVDAAHIYWTNTGALDVEGKAQEGEGTIGRADIDGTDGDLSFISGASDPLGIDVDAAHVYWVNAGLNGPANSGFVGRADIDASNPKQEFVSFASGDVAVNASKIYFSRTNNIDGFIRRSNLDGTGNENLVLVTGASTSPEGLALDGSHLYWTDPGRSTIGRADLDGKNPNLEFIKGANHPLGLAVDVSHVYWSANQGVDPNLGNDLYRYEAGTGKLTDLAPDHAHANGTEVRGVLGASDDGSYVYFAANGVPDGVTNTPNARGEEAVPGSCAAVGAQETGVCNLYLANDGAVAFIARLDADGNGSQSDTVNWTPTRKAFALTNFNFQKPARVTPDGLTLLFRSQRRLSDYDNEGRAVLYRYRAGDLGPSCVSCNPTGEPLSIVGPQGIFTPVQSTAPPAPTLSRSLSASGEQVFFESTDALLAADTNGDAGCPIVGSNFQQFRACQDVYEWEASGSGSCRSEAQNGGCLYLLSSGKSPEPSFFADASASGRDAFIFTREQLVPTDRDQLIDVYDARAEGGLASQNQPPPIICEGEACKPATIPPALPEPCGSACFSGPGDSAEPRKPRCPKGKRKVKARGKTRCVAKHQKHQSRSGGHRPPQRGGRSE